MNLVDLARLRSGRPGYRAPPFSFRSRYTEVGPRAFHLEKADGYSFCDLAVQHT